MGKKIFEYFTLPSDEQRETDLRKIINRHDRSYGLNLKDPQTVNYGMQYNILKKEFTEDLMDIMKEFNQIDSGSYDNPRLFVSEITNRGKSPEGLKIFKNSPLWNGRLERVPIMKNIFRARFLVLLYSEMAKYIDDVVDLEFKKTGHSVTKEEERYLILKSIVDTTEQFHDAYVNGEDSLTFALKLGYYFSEKSTKKKRESAQLLEDHLAIIRMHETWIGYSLDDDVLINDLAKMAYVAVTENPDINQTTPTKLDVTLGDRDMIRKIMLGLGEDIIWYKHQHKKRTSIFYDAFLYAQPEMFCSFTDIDTNTAIRVAVRAMYYLAFLTNNRKLWKLIQKIV